MLLKQQIFTALNRKTVFTLELFFIFEIVIFNLLFCGQFGSYDDLDGLIQLIKCGSPQPNTKHMCN